jgi:catechol 2,3-dioxygenase-like lactoylglutathione lyase family enzyme
MGTHYVNPRYRAYGKARIDIAKRIKDPADWDLLWRPPLHKFPFQWGQRWKQCIEYQVDDFAAEVGFLVDILGLPVLAFDSGYAMFTGPEEDFTFAVVPTPEDGQSTPPDTIRLQFMVADIFDTTEELQRRGIVFEGQPEPIAEDSSVFISSFRTPHGILIELWAEVEAEDQEIEPLIVAGDISSTKAESEAIHADEAVVTASQDQNDSESLPEMNGLNDEDQITEVQSEVEYEDILDNEYLSEDSTQVKVDHQQRKDHTGKLEWFRSKG